MMNPDRVTYFAATNTRGKRIPFGIKQKDRSRHMYVIGKTGVGKSTLLQNMAIQDIRNGESVVFIDPHGDAAERLLSFVPERRIKDVIYFAPFDLERPVPFNVLENVDYEKRSLVISGLIATFRKLFADVWEPKLEFVFTNALLALVEHKDGTLPDVERLVTDAAFREHVAQGLTNTAVREFWLREFDADPTNATRKAATTLGNKIRLLCASPFIQPIVSASDSAFTLRDVMDTRKILIVNLARGLIGEANMRLLGSMLTTSLFLAAASRTDVGAEALENLPPCYYYVDEFQNFANDTFVQILSEARKYKLCLIVSHQYLEQTDAAMRAAVFGNVGTMVSFRVGPFDADALEPIFRPECTKEDLIHLGTGEMYLTLMIDGVASRPFSAIGIPAIVPPQENFRKEVITMSRETLGVNRSLLQRDGLHIPQEQEAQAPMPAPDTVSDNTEKKEESAASENGFRSVVEIVAKKAADERQKREEGLREALREVLQEVLQKERPSHREDISRTPSRHVSPQTPYEVPDDELRSIFKDTP